jgi:hypothetical protein
MSFKIRIVFRYAHRSEASGIRCITYIGDNGTLNNFHDFLDIFVMSIRISFESGYVILSKSCLQ